ncbi:MAG: hypothetical protein M3R70_00595 [Actinomycetota bacterium]|nr:hypothetical protein [Actinomycetota bacterium]
MDKHRFRWILGWATLLGAALLLAGGTTVATGAPAAKQLKQHVLLNASQVGPSDGTMSAPAARAMQQGYLVPNQAAYMQAKGITSSGTSSGASLHAPMTPLSSLAPIATGGWDGLINPNSAPSDSTSSVGTSRFIETVNSNYAIYNKGAAAPISTGTLNALAGISGSAFDPQIMWDSQTNRFYYAMDVVVSSATHVLGVGFSKTPSPNTSADWCKYSVNYGANFPDYPKLGDSAFFWIIGSNVFNSADAFIGSDAIGISKPANGAITICPSATTFKFGEKFDLRDSTNGPAFTPVPVNQTDVDAGPGYIVARTGSLPSTRFSLHRVNKAASGVPVFTSPGSAVVVPGYTVPPNAVQRASFPNGNKRLDTLDSRPTQAVSGYDPAHPTVSGAPRLGIWVQHTTNTIPAARSEVRWYEINPLANNLFQLGKVNNPSWFAFNGAIAPDRSGYVALANRHGQNMVLGFDTSGTGSVPAVRMVSKLGLAAQSLPVIVRVSPGNYVGFDCAGTDNDCRWGDYAGASPDPFPFGGASGHPTGKVWLTSQYASGGISTLQSNWKTWNWAATP